ncbi:MAG: hypothetical protein HUJ74_03670 [Lachnospiraceae bacterium]|nr:hypothetical protein [Lachnospiraceae bacterium]
MKILLTEHKDITTLVSAVFLFIFIRIRRGDYVERAEFIKVLLKEISAVLST